MAGFASLWNTKKNEVNSVSSHDFIFAVLCRISRSLVTFLGEGVKLPRATRLWRNDLNEAQGQTAVKKPEKLFPVVSMLLLRAVSIFILIGCILLKSSKCLDGWLHM